MSRRKLVCREAFSSYGIGRLARIEDSVAIAAESALARFCEWRGLNCDYKNKKSKKNIKNCLQFEKNCYIIAFVLSK